MFLLSFLNLKMKQDKNQTAHILQPPLQINEDEYKK